MTVATTVFRYCIYALVVFALSACGGGGGGGNSGGGGSNNNPGSGGSLVVNPTTLTFTATQHDVLPLARNIVATFSEPDIAVVVAGFPAGGPQPTWLDLSIFGNGSPLNINVRPNTTALAPGNYTATVRVITARADQTIISLRDVPVTYTVSAFQPLLQGSYVVPYVATTNVAGDVIIRGQGLAGVTSVSFNNVGAGNVSGTNVSVVNGTEVHASYPGLPAGVYAVTLNAGAIPFSANLVVVDAPAFAAESIPYPAADLKQVRSIVYDAERKALVVGLSDLSGIGFSGVLRYAYTSSWQAPASTSMSPLRDVALSLDGAKLFALANTNIRPIDAVSLTQGAPVEAPGFNPGSAGLKSLAIANDGNAIVTSGENLGSGNSTLYVFGTGNSSFLSVPNTPGFFGLSKATAAASGDGSRVVLLQRDATIDSNVYQYRASPSALSATGLMLDQFGGSHIVPTAVDRAGTRIVMQGTRVYDKDYVLLGTLPSTTIAVVLKPDGTRAYTFDDSGRVRTWDLTVNPVGAGAFSEIGSPGVTPTADPGFNAKIAITPDGGTLFLAGGDRIVVMPVP